MAHCENTIKRLLTEGISYEGTLDFQNPDDRPDLDLFRISRFHDAELRSLLQKHIRRGDQFGAAQVVWQLWPGDSWWIKRRLGLITAEDVGWEVLPQVLDRLIINEESLIANLAAEMAALPKSKDAAWLLELARLKLKDDISYSRGQLFTAIGSGDLVEASRILWAASKAGDLYVGAELIAELELGGGGEPKRVALLRMRDGAGEWDEMYLANCALLAMTIDPMDIVLDGEVVKGFETPVMEMPWYALDQHTWWGKRAISRVAKEVGKSDALVGELMFNYSSAWLNPERDDQIYKEAALNAIAVEYGFKDDQDARDYWETLLQPKIEKALSWKR